MTEPPRRIDHLVHAVDDLDGAADLYRRLGFQVGARNRHPWGTENRLVQFGSSFIELITVGDGAEIAPHAPGSFSFGAFVRDYLRERQGLAMLVLDSADARADAARFAAAGIGDFDPFFFEREGRRPDGSATRVAFTLAFAADPGLPAAGFFVCQQHFPESFWNPAFQRHPNGATDIRAVTIAAGDPPAHAGFLAAFTGSPARRAVDGLNAPLRGGGHIDVERTGDAEGIVAFATGVPDLAAQAEILAGAGILFEASGDRVTVHAAEALGAGIAFRAGAGGTRRDMPPPAPCTA
ncbi:VOC family protein [Amaricoccus solimangrovi]|uniref:VOC family protein n=1 Tax=Amaricoccus solimangrovi TaxID=2589815 RepID=A0A501WC72_9RHOB|nr:VOC family protein [Amaricoccus solimangrovi]TPE45674.1 VOC family protein [Amaricoccus solimangrovi]